MTSEGTLKDKVIIVLHFIRSIKGKFHVGVGVMLSFTAEDPVIPCFQKVFLISDSISSQIR